MVFRGEYLEIHPSGSECILKSCIQHQGSRCSTWEGREAQRGGRDKESFKDHPPATLGRVVGSSGQRNGKNVW